MVWRLGDGPKISKGGEIGCQKAVMWQATKEDEESALPRPMDDLNQPIRN